jgi:hypothetical protein
LLKEFLANRSKTLRDILSDLEFGLLDSLTP